MVLTLFQAPTPWYPPSRSGANNNKGTHPIPGTNPQVPTPRYPPPWHQQQQQQGHHPYVYGAINHTVVVTHTYFYMGGAHTPLFNHRENLGGWCHKNTGGTHPSLWGTI